MPITHQLTQHLLTAHSSPLHCHWPAALAAYPVSFSGTLADPNGVTAAQIREGGLQLILDLSCDLFVNPQTSLANVPFMNVSDTGSVGNRATANIIAAGMLAIESSDNGFNRVVRPLLLHPGTPVFAATSFGSTRLTITLPPVPAYAPTSDERIAVAIPSGECIAC